MIEIQHPNKCKHNFREARWQELVEIHALEELARWVDNEMPNRKRRQRWVLVSLA
jgi:hypothetical protein